MWTAIGISAACILVGWVICLQLALNRMRAMQDLYDNTSAEVAAARYDAFKKFAEVYVRDMTSVSERIANLDGKVVRLSQIVQGDLTIREEGLTVAVKRIDASIKALTARLGATPGEGEDAEMGTIEGRLSKIDQQVCELIGEDAAQWQQVGRLPADVRKLHEDVRRLEDVCRTLVDERNGIDGKWNDMQRLIDAEINRNKAWRETWDTWDTARNELVHRLQMSVKTFSTRLSSIETQPPTANKPKTTKRAARKTNRSARKA